MPELGPDPLGLSAEQMRELGYRTIDLLVDELTDREVPAMRRGEPDELRARLATPPPARPRAWDELLAQTRTDVLGPMSRLAHRGYFAFIPASSTFPGALGDLIASALDIDVASWTSAAGPSQLEVVVLEWFKQWIGYPPEAGGILVSGGSAANITALACARESLLGPMSGTVVAYVADQAHSSVARAARLLGFRPDQLRVLPTDSRHRIRLDALVGAIDADTTTGLRPLVVCANAGATNTGAVDPLAELADICHDRGMWLHVDGAYGGFAALTERGRRQLAGIELADSVTLDPHRWLYQPIECGCLLVREGRLLAEAFTVNPEYLADYKGEEVNFSDLGLQLTRTARALKVWLSLGYYGTDAFREAIDRSLDLAELAEKRIREDDELELLSPATLGIVCFRRRFDGVSDEAELAELNGELVGEFERTGRGLVSSTFLHGTYAIRMCVMNHTSGPDDVRETLEWFARTARPARPAPVRRVAHVDRHADVVGGWGEATDFDEVTIRRLPLFAELPPDALELVVGSARERKVGSGQTVIQRWHGTRHFYAIVDGEVEIRGDGERPIRRLGPGGFFGELAPLDWGSGFGYTPTASAVATTETRLLVLSPSALSELIRRAPDLERRLRGAARERLRGAAGERLRNT